MARIRTRHNLPKNEDDFEILCMKLLRRKWNAPGLVQYGKRGERQHGIDLIDTGGQCPARAAQCKLHEPHKAISPTEIQDEVEKAKGTPFKLEVYAIATTAKPSTPAHRKIVEINEKHLAEGSFRVELYHWREIEDLLDEFSDVREEIYGGMDAEQVARISGQLRDVKLAVEQLGPANHDRFKSVLQEAKNAIDERDYPVAKRLLQRLQAEHWGELDSVERFLLLTRLAVVRFAEGATEDAANLFLKAKPFQPDDEKALTNEALAFHLHGDSTRAHQLATALRKRFPHSAQLAGVWVNSAPGDTPVDNLIMQLDQHMLADGEVAVPLAIRLLQTGGTKRAESLLAAVKFGKAEWSTVYFLRARAIVATEMKLASRQGDRDHSERQAKLREAETLFSRAAELGTEERQVLATAEALLDRAQVRRLLDDNPGAETDIERAFTIAPDEVTVIVQMADLLRRRGQADKAADMLTRANQLSPRIDIQYTLAAALRDRGKPGDCAKAAEIMRTVAIATPDAAVVPGGREHAISIAVECLAREKLWDEATTLLTSLPSGFLEPVAIASMLASLALQQKDFESANHHADNAVSLLKPDTDRDAVAYLAGLLSDLGRHKDALPLWERVVRPGEPGPDPRRLLDTAYRLGRHDVILRTCDEFRKAGTLSLPLLQYELAVLEEYDVDSAVRTIQDYLKINPDDQLMRLRLSTIGIRLNRDDIVDSHPSHMPPVKDIDPAVGLAAVRVMKLRGHPDDALAYAYELLRRHFDDPEAHRAYTLLLLPLGPKPSIEELHTAEPNAAVCYVEQHTVEQRWIVIEDVPEGAPRFNDEVPTSSPLAKELHGKRVGDVFTLAPSGISPRLATITQLLNKYIYRYQDCMGQWQVRFPEEPDVHSIQVKRVEPHGELDISEILKAIDRRHEASQQLEQVYRVEPIPIHMFAAQLGRDAFEGVHYLAANDASTLFCCAGTKEEREAAFEAMQVATAVVVDITAIATLAILDATEVLRTFPSRFIVSQATMELLQEHLVKEQLNTAKGGSLGKTDSGYAMIEYTEAHRLALVSQLSALIDLVRTVATIVPCRELAGFEVERRQLLDKAFGRYGAEAIVLASTPSHVLWTDDHRQARFASTEHGVRRTWTQAVLQFAALRGIITPAQYLDASAKLLGSGYEFTASNSQVLLRAGAAAEWDPNRRPFKQVLDQFKSEHVDLTPQVQLATLFLTQLYREPVAEAVRDQVLLRILDNLATRPNGLDGIRAIHQVVPRAFGLNVVGAGQCAARIKRWLEVHTARELIIP